MSSGFVSEKELDEKRQKRQEEWEKVRTAEQPLGEKHTCLCLSVFLRCLHISLPIEFFFSEAPEEVYDHRSLFERLEEQRKKKDDEFEEAHKLSELKILYSIFYVYGLLFIFYFIQTLQKQF